MELGTEARWLRAPLPFHHFTLSCYVCRSPAGQSVMAQPLLPQPLPAGQQQPLPPPLMPAPAPKLFACRWCCHWRCSRGRRCCRCWCRVHEAFRTVKFFEETHCLNLQVGAPVRLCTCLRVWCGCGAGGGGGAVHVRTEALAHAFVRLPGPAAVRSHSRDVLVSRCILTAPPAPVGEVHPGCMHGQVCTGRNQCSLQSTTSPKAARRRPPDAELPGPCRL